MSAPSNARLNWQSGVPTGMTRHVHAFDPRQSGSFRVPRCAARLGWRTSLANLAALVEAAGGQH